MVATIHDEQEKDMQGKRNVFFYVLYGKIVVSAQLTEVPLLGVGTVFRLERDTWSMVK